MATQAVILTNPHNPQIRRFPLHALYTCRDSSTNRPLFSQNKPNVKIGKINISTTRTKAYAKKQRTMTNEHYPKQTQSKPISEAETAYPACRTRACHGLLAPRNYGFLWISVPGSALRYVSPLAALGRNDPGLWLGEAATRRDCVRGRSGRGRNTGWKPVLHRTRAGSPCHDGRFGGVGGCFCLHRGAISVILMATEKPFVVTGRPNLQFCRSLSDGCERRSGASHFNDDEKGVENCCCWSPGVGRRRRCGRGRVEVE